MLSYVTSQQQFLSGCQNGRVCVLATSKKGNMVKYEVG